MTRYGKCTNVGNDCSKAETSQLITIVDGAEFECPECHFSLNPASHPKNSKKRAYVTSAVIFTIFIAVGFMVFMGFPELEKNPVSNPDLIAGNTPPTSILPKPVANKDLYAIIEIGASGIKPAVLQLIYIEEGDQTIVEEKKIKKIESKKYDVVKLDANNRAAFHPDSINYIAGDLKNYINEFLNNYGIPGENIFIVGSSSVAQVEHKDKLQQAIQDSTGIKMDFVTAEQESKYVFNGVLKLIPKERGQQDKRKREVVVIDIGSGNTKGGYYDTSMDRIATFEVKYGTKTFAKKIDDQKKDKSFSDKAKNLRENELRPLIRSEANRIPGLLNKQRVYLIGGIPWATSTLLSLDSPHYGKRSATGDQAIYTVMNFKKPSDVDLLYNRVTGSRAIEQVCEDNASANLFTDILKKEERLKEANKICDSVFNMHQLTAGLEILKALALELRFNEKHVFFIQNALHAWPIGYITEKIAENQD